ncbi:RluA family pseudouridine synthase [Marinicella sp. S1101]|uniref:RluA family pseudouridine synthase n=1 Tax=Marinicella marina TaxID=2996016 RepID=UPI002260BB5A|nr:RluA family pseudouridine synthase [Marinicella marina]MCX7552923.1 RluA family pseudouridine synthase [Marinicella marina]MDJ1139768.1 RluA family pseudouridine synthase [Marinicella marina]
MIYQPPMEPYLNVIYQDDDVLVLNKPSGLLSVPGRKESHKDSLQTRAQQLHPTATTVHRLDMETSGLIIMAMNKPAHVNLGQQFEQRKVHKSYVARVYGHPKDDAGSVDKPLICDWPNRPKQMVDYDHGKQALTHWQVLKKEGLTTLIELKPITGRSHQLRVHMKAIELPIVGDQLYAEGAALSHADRLQLHSQLVEFSHPTTDKKLRFEVKADFI